MIRRGQISAARQRRRKAGKPSILEIVAQSRSAFEIEFNARRAVLAERFQLFRLARYHQSVRRRFERRYQRPMRQAAPLKHDASDWRSWDWQFGADDNLPLSTLENAMITFRADPAIAGIVGLDMGDNKIKLKAPLPHAYWESFDFAMRPLRDDDLTGLLEYLQSLGLATLSRDDCLAAVRLTARENAWWPE